MIVTPITITPPSPMSQKIDILPVNRKTTQFEVTDNIITVKENDEFNVNCIVEQSKPPAQIHLSINDANNANMNGVATSLISTTKNVILNNDRTYKTVSMSRLKAHVNDHGRVITCKAENGLSNQNWENRRLLNVLCKYNS
jgi:hypothetical protein